MLVYALHWQVNNFFWFQGNPSIPTAGKESWEKDTLPWSNYFVALSNYYAATYYSIDIGFNSSNSSNTSTWGCWLQKYALKLFWNRMHVTKKFKYIGCNFKNGPKVTRKSWTNSILDSRFYRGSSVLWLEFYSANQIIQLQLLKRKAARDSKLKQYK